MRTTWVLALMVGLCGLSVEAFAGDPEGSRGRLTESEDRIESQETINDATAVYRTIVQDQKIPDSVLKSAKCVAVFPSVMSVAVVMGGTHGDGVGFCRNSAQQWSAPIFLNLGGSLGLQAGAKSADVVLFMTSEKARTALERGEFALTGELSAVAGSFEKNYVAPAAGVVAYNRTGGLFAGAALNGASIRRDKEDERAFFGTEQTGSILERKTPAGQEKSIAELRSMLPTTL